VRGALVCAANVSEGRDAGVLDALRAAAGDALLDVHVDLDHHRCVLTMAGAPVPLVERVRALATVAMGAIDLRRHAGAHPRMGALDVVPFAPLEGGSLDAAVAAREAAMQVLAGLGIPSYRYGPVPGGSIRTLPEVRRAALAGLDPDAGPARPHPTAGTTAVGARTPLVAWNVWLHGASLAEASRVAAEVRGASVLALGFEVTGATQVSCNLLDPAAVTPLDVYRRVEAELPAGAHVVRCELVGLVPERALRAVPEEWWELLDLAEDRAVEARVAGIPLG
jgi:glutamate formiminotransferase / 5-formyltetrahydrofolate cyclo-ligase